MTTPSSPRAVEKSAETAVPSCASCGSTDLRLEFPSAEPGFEIRRCPACGLGRTWPDVPASRIGGWYPETYYGKENVRFNALFERMTHLFQWRRARVLHNRVPRGPVLDVGCGRGFLLSYLRSLGYRPVGVELSEVAAWHARNRLRLNVRTEDFLSADLEKEGFHAVIFWHTLEHFARPRETLARARELLKPGGLIAVAVPNSESLQARLFGRHWFHLDVPRHYFHFGARSLERMLSREGFRIVQLDHFCFEQNPYGWLQSFYNALGFDFNFLYALLKKRSARTIQIRKHPFQALGTALLLPPLLFLSLGLTLLEAALRRGGTIEVYAIKE